MSAAEQNNPLQPCEPRYGLRAGIEGTISEGLRCHGLRRARYRGQPKTQLQARAIAAAINEGKHPSDVAKDSSWTPASTQASFVSFCSFATALGDMMSGQNFPAESLIHPQSELTYRNTEHFEKALRGKVSKDTNMFSPIR